jgi:hypothetical protein
MGMWLFGAAVAAPCAAQTPWTIAPDTLLTAVVPLDGTVAEPTFTFTAFEDTAFLVWRRIDLDVPAGWTCDACDTGECYGGVPIGADFPPIAPGGTGFLKLIEGVLRLSGGQMEATSLATLCGLSRPTVVTYLEVLELTHVATLVRPFSGGGHRELVRQPKIYGFDTGFVAYTRGWSDLRPEDCGLCQVLQSFDRRDRLTLAKGDSCGRFEFSEALPHRVW